MGRPSVPVNDLRDFLKRRAEAFVRRRTNQTRVIAAASSAALTAQALPAPPVPNPQGIGRGYSTIARRPTLVGQVTIGGPFKRPRSPVRAPATTSPATLPTTPAPSASESTTSAPERIGTPTCPRSTADIETIDITDEDDW